MVECGWVLVRVVGGLRGGHNYEWWMVTCADEWWAVAVVCVCVSMLLVSQRQLIIVPH